MTAAPLPLPTTPTELDPLAYACVCDQCVVDGVRVRFPGHYEETVFAPRPQFVQDLSAYENGEQR